MGGLWKLLGGWMLTIFVDNTLRLYHHLIMWLIIAFIFAHVYISWFVERAEKNGLISSMFSGYKVDFGKEPGYIGILENKDIPAVLHSKLSVHHIGLGEVLLASEMLGIMPDEICLIGIQPCTFETGIDLSTVLASKINELLRRVIEKLNLWAVEWKERSSDVPCSAIKDNP
ncbi:MAG: hydrogenase maturation protease [Thermodesulfovibrionales bacterium]